MFTYFNKCINFLLKLKQKNINEQGDQRYIQIYLQGK